MQQLASTMGQEPLAAHRDLVVGRWEQAKSFALADVSPKKLSPNARKYKEDFFGDAESLSTSLLKTVKKKFTGYLQSLTNASDRLNEVQREECHSILQWGHCISML